MERLPDKQRKPVAAGVVAGGAVVAITVAVTVWLLGTFVGLPSANDAATTTKCFSQQAGLEKAAWAYEAEQGMPPGSLADLEAFAPAPACPSGGTYSVSWSEAGPLVTCTEHGSRQEAQR